MALDLDVVRRVAALAHVQLTAEEETHLAAELNHILTHIESLQSVDTSGVDAARHAEPGRDVLADDVVRPSLSRAAVLAEAHDVDAASGLIHVPRVV